MAWRKASSDQIRECYTDPLEVKLEGLLGDMDIPDGLCDSQIPENNEIIKEKLETLVSNLNEIILSQGEKLPHTEFSKKLKPYWSRELTRLNKENKNARREWVNAGKPEDPLHPIKVQYKVAKNKFRKEQRLRQYEYELENLKQLNETQELDNKYFWYLVNKKRKCYKETKSIQNNEGTLLTDVNDIRNDWNQYYKELYSNDYSDYDQTFRQNVENEMDIVFSAGRLKEDKFLSGGPIKEDEVRRHINKMKNNKAAGYDGITVEHFKYGGNALVSVTTWILNSVTEIESIPPQLKRGLIISIPKGSKDSTVKTNNRGITLLPILYKLLENIILDRESECFSHAVNDLQGAAQPKCSCVHTSMVVQETVEYHVSRGASIYVAFLDIQKAFDTVWIQGMLYKLHKISLNHKALTLIKNAYEDFYCAAFVGGEPGEWFTPQRGVHQGAPLSMKLYQIYINDLLEELIHCRYGVRIGGINVTSPGFADDLAPMAFHKFGLNQLLKIAEIYRKKWHFDFSVPKCLVMVWGKDTDSNVDVKLGSHSLTLVPSIKHMGITLISDNKLETGVINTRISAATSVVFASRGIGSYEAPVPPTILSKIYWTVAVPRMVYGLEVTPITDKLIEECEASHRKLCKLIQGLPGNTPLPAPLATLSWMSMKSYIAMRKIMFLVQLISLPDYNIYKRLVYHILGQIGPRIPDISRSPIAEMYRAAWQYGMGIDIWNSLLWGNIVSTDSQKRLVKKEIWKRDELNWRATCTLYSKLTMYRNVLKDIGVIAWWKYAKINPCKLKQVSAAVALLLGAQPKGLQHNFGGHSCMLCGLYVNESSVHILFECNLMNEKRDHWLNTIRLLMPTAMVIGFDEMSVQSKCEFLLSGLNNCHVQECDVLYGAIAVCMGENNKNHCT